MNDGENVNGVLQDDSTGNVWSMAPRQRWDSEIFVYGKRTDLIH